MVNWHLLPGEIKIYETKTSWKIYWREYLLAFLVFSAGAYFLLYNPIAQIPYQYSSGFLFAVFIVLFMKPTIKRRKEMVLITNERVLIRRGGMFSKQTNLEAVTYNNLINVRVLQNRFQKTFNLGDIVFLLSGDEHKITDIDNPYAIERAVYKIIEKEKAGMKPAEA